ncbi:type IV pili twitching motility protein PilT [Helicobacter sp. 16-1353]|nr:type IV pili twitching motility protein PilT [Helicobacter sp. 16-1353]
MNEINTESRIDTSLENINKNPNLKSLIVDVDKLDFEVTKKVRIYLKKLVSIGGSDLHLKAGSKIRARINGDIVIFSEDVFSKEDAITLAKELTRTRFPEFALNKEMDMTYIYDSNTRFRVNLYFQMEGVSFAFRSIPTTQSTIDELGLPDAIHDIVDMERGLVLVTGITGSGKSTTLAAIINEINHKKAKHIITIEDPIEFIHKDEKSMLNQRSVGMDTNSFASALKAALREDPDIILVGEMRDIETIEMALHAAETGHLVLSTLHTLDAKETINRIISVFPTNDQVRIRATLGSTLAAIISQRLLKARNGGRIAAIELLFKTPRIELIINEGRDGEILEALAEGKEIYHTQTFDQHLFELVTNGIVDEDVAMEKATSPSDLKLRLQNINFTEQEGNMDTISIKK